MYKKLVLGLFTLLIACSLVGCDITPQMVDSVAQTAAVLISEDGNQIYATLNYAGRYFYMHYDVVGETIKYGTITFKRASAVYDTLLLTGYVKTTWDALGAATQLVITSNLVEALPLYPLWQAPIFILPVLPGMPNLQTGTTLG